jgi:CHAT domain-containing protein
MLKYILFLFISVSVGINSLAGVEWKKIETFIFKGDFSKANFILNKSIRHGSLNLRDKAAVYQTIGDIDKLSGDIDNALKYWKLAAQIRRKIYPNRKSSNHAWTYASLSNYHYEKIHPELAEIYADSCSVLLKNLTVSQQKEIQIYRIWNILAQSYKQAFIGDNNVNLPNKYKRIISFYEQSTDFIIKHNCPKHYLGKTFHLLGNAHLDLAAHSQVQRKTIETQKFHITSIQYFDKAIAIWKELYGDRHYELGKSLFVKALSFSYTAKSFPENVLKSIQQFRLSADAYGVSIKNVKLEAVNEIPNKEDLLMCLKYYTTTLLVLDKHSKTNKSYLIEAEKVNRMALHLWDRIHQEYKSENTNQNLAIYTILPQSEQLDILWRNSKFKKLDLDKFFLANQQLKYFDLNKSKNGFKKISIKSIQRQLTSEQVYLDFQHGHNNGLIYIFEICKHSCNIRVVNDTILKLSERYKKAIIEFEYQQYVSSAYSLFCSLFPNGIKQDELIICPDSYFSTVPFEALLVSKKKYKTNDYRKLDYLMNSVSIRTVLTPSSFSNQVLKVNRDVAVFAPRFIKQNFSELVFSHEFGSKSEQELGLKLFSSEKATTSNFLNCNSPVIHASTHSLVGEDDSKNEILFSNGSLKQSELNFQKTVPNLVTLNSCNSGLGKQLEGDGLNGFVRELHRIGVKSTIGNLWEVDDKASNELFFQFYSDLKQGKSSTSALRAAKLQQIKNAPNSELGAPYYWAGHRLVGENIMITNKEVSYQIYFLCFFGAFGLLLLFYFNRQKKR